MSTNPADDNKFIADDVQAQALAENKLDPDTLVEDDDTPVTSGDLEIGDLDHDDELTQGSEQTFDEEAVPGGEDNVSGDPGDEIVEPDDVASE